MADFFYDTKFCEGYKKPFKWLPTIGRFNKPYHAIELISIGMVASDGRTFYAVSNEFDLDWAWDKFQINQWGEKEYWLRENVLRPIYREMLSNENHARTYHWDLVEPFSKKTLKNLLRWRGNTNYQIACKILSFAFDPDGAGLKGWLGFTDDFFKGLRNMETNKPELYGYYSDYDHVILCSLFGTMIDLPKSFPMYTRDLKQMLDEYVELKRRDWSRPADFDMLAEIKAMNAYPKQTNEHNALDDAHFNQALYKFLQPV